MRTQPEPLSLVEQSSFGEADLERLKQSFPGEFEGCHFEGIKFAGVSLRSSVFLECRFTDCSLAGAELRGAAFRDVPFIDCNLMGLDWTSLKRFENCRFQGCKLDFSCFQGLKLKRFGCTACSLKEVDFSQAQLSEADFSESLLRGASFVRSDLSKADFKTAKEYFIDPLSTKIKGTKFRLPDALALLAALGAEVEY